MTKLPPENDINTLLEELYLIDPTLQEHQVDLPELISLLKTSRPDVVINATFVENLRATLLEKAAVQSQQNTSVPSPFVWWAARLTPIGVALFIFITLLPPSTPPLINESVPNESLPPTVNMTPPSELDVAPSSNDDASMMTMKSAASSLTVFPPLVGTTATITSVTFPTSGWLVIHADKGGELGDVLGSAFLETGAHQDIVISLSRTLVYPEMITVVVYTGSVRERFDAGQERIQSDPLTDAPMMVTVPVISELELQIQQ